MAVIPLRGNDYAVVETNHVASVRDGLIKAQYVLDGVAKTNGVENGMLLEVSEANKKVFLPSIDTNYVHLHASEERIYERHLGRKTAIVQGEQMPKMVRLTEGDIFETNAVDLDGFGDVENAKANGKYGVPSITGFIKLVEEDDLADTLSSYAVVLQVLDWITLPNGEVGIKFLVIQESPFISLNDSTLKGFKFLADGNDAIVTDVEGVYDGVNIAITVPYGTDVEAIIPTFTIAESSTAVLTSDDSAVVSGDTAIDFTNPVGIKVISAQSGETTYTVIVTIAAQTDEAIVAADKILIEEGSPYEIPVGEHQATQTAKTAWVQNTLNDIAINGSTVEVEYNDDESKYDVTITKGSANAIADIVVEYAQ